MDKHQILEQIQHIIVCYNQVLRAGGLPSDVRYDVEEAIDIAEDLYKKVSNREVIDYKLLMNKRNA